MSHWVIWVSVVVLVLAFLFFIASILVLEFGTKVSKNGNLVIPWYYWFFFIGTGILFLVFVILQIYAPHAEKKIVEKKNDYVESWVSGDKLYTEYGQRVYTIPKPGEADPMNIRAEAVRQIASGNVQPDVPVRSDLPQITVHTPTGTQVSVSQTSVGSQAPVVSQAPRTYLDSLRRVTYLS